ncbi:MAG TPA: DoxX family membrane protein, partial [Bacteroidetes bacterium]|nr:DoxX family membrane protein [Bacteroidota bacterium]
MQGEFVKSVRVVKIILGIILIFSGIAKIADPSKAVNLMLEFKVIPELVILIVVSILPILEILIGVLLISGMYPKFASISALVLFSGFFFISIYGTLIGLSSDCGCFGSVIKSRIGWGMVVRNGMFVVGAVYG